MWNKVPPASGSFGRSLLNTAAASDARTLLGMAEPSYDYYPYASSSNTGAQNRSLIQAAIDAAPVGTNIHLPGGTILLDQAGSAVPGQASYDYCLRGKTGVRLVGHNTTLKLNDDQLVYTPSLRHLAIIDISTANSGASITDFSVVGVKFDGNPKNQNGYSTYAQLGATMAIRSLPGLVEAEQLARIHLEDLETIDFFGNPINIGGGSAYFVDGVYWKNILAKRCGEGPQLIRAKNIYLENIRYVDDNPTTLLGVGTGYVTVGDPIELSYCEDGVCVGLSVFAGAPTNPLGPWSGGGSAIDLFNSQRIKVSGLNAYWSNGVECGITPVGCKDIILDGVHLRNPTPASVSTSTIGIDACPDLQLSNVVIEDYGIPLRCPTGPWTTGTGCVVDFANLTIKGGGENAGAQVIVRSGDQFRGTNLQIEPNEFRDGSLTTMTSTTEGTITLTKSPTGFIATNDTVRVVWVDTSGIRRYRTSVVSVSGSVLTLSGGSGTDLPSAATAVIVDKPLNAANLQNGISVIYNAAGVSADTRIELTGGRIRSAGPAIFVDGSGNTFAPNGFVKGLDATSSNGGAWPFTLGNSGLWNNIEVRDVQPKQALMGGAYYAGAEVLVANTNVTSLPNGSKNQELFLKRYDVANPFTPDGTFNFGSTSAATASRLNLYPYLVLQAFENSAGVYLRRDDSLVYNEVGRWYPVHQNRPGLLTFTAPVTVGGSYNATPVNYRMPAYGRLTSNRVRFSNLAAARTAGTITITPWRDGATFNTLNINGTNTTGDARVYNPRLGDTFAVDSLLRFAIVVSGDFTNSGGATDLVLEMAYET